MYRELYSTPAQDKKRRQMHNLRVLAGIALACIAVYAMAHSSLNMPTREPVACVWVVELQRTICDNE